MPAEARPALRLAPAAPAVYSLDGLLVFGLLLVCTCAYLRKVPRLKAWLLSEKRGVWGVFYKGEMGMRGSAMGTPGSEMGTRVVGMGLLGVKVGT